MDSPVVEPVRPSPAPANDPLPAVPDLADAREMVEARCFWTEYEPIVDLRTLRTAGYEALARFHRPGGAPVAPGPMLAALHADRPLLARAELELKQHQIACAPAKGELFVNLDPDGWDRGVDEAQSPLLALLAGVRRRVVVAVVENLDAADAIRGRGLVAALKARGVPVALGDVGATNGPLSFESLDDADVLKFDRSLLRRLGGSNRRRALLGALVAVARRTGARTVLGRVETPRDLSLARELGVDLVQGWLFRDRTVQARG